MGTVLVGGKPKISVNKLGEFMTSTATRQKGIVRDQVADKPPGFKAFRYTEARAACSRYFIEGFNVSVLDEAIAIIDAKEELNKHDKNDKKVSIEALNELKLLDTSAYKDFVFTRFEGPGAMEIAGVDVKVNPDLIIRAIHKKKKVIGAVKFHLKKTQRLTPAGQEIVAIVVNKLIAEKIKAEDEVAKYELMLSIDLFNGGAIAAPKNQTQDWRSIESSCSIYSALWREAKESLKR